MMPASPCRTAWISFSIAALICSTVLTFIVYSHHALVLVDGAARTMQSQLHAALVARGGLQHAAQRHALEAERAYQQTTRTTQQRLAVFSWVVGIVTFVMLGVAQVYRAWLVETASRRMDVLADQAMNDTLTGLGNRRAFEEELERECSAALRYNEPFSIMLVDIDSFKQTNDTLGHAAGDEVLRRASQLLAQLRQTDSAFRTGGDEFAVLLRHTPADGASTVARRLVKRAAQLLGDTTLSIGIAQLRAGESSGDLRERADIALYQAKRQGRNRAVVFDDIESGVHFVSSDALARVRDILSRDEMNVAFQPIWDRESGNIMAVEALARPPQWSRFAGPHELFEAAQRIGELFLMDLLCLRAALTAAKAQGIRHKLFLNIMPATLENPRFSARDVAALVHRAGFSVQNVVLEITEQRINAIDAVVRNCGQLRSSGFAIALDDVGSGSAGLGLLSAMPVDFVKIDRSLLVQAQASKARAVLTGILTIADAMGAYVIAEGIEDVELLRFAAALHEAPRSYNAGVRGFQGYLLGRPAAALPASDAAALFQRETASPVLDIA